MNKHFKWLRFVLAVAVVSAMAMESALAVPPSISSFSPALGAPGDKIDIFGSGFSNPMSIWFNGTPASGGPTTTSHIEAYVPAGATSGFITVQTVGGTAQSGQQFTVIGTGPYITDFTPSFGSPVYIYGVHFAGTTSVKFAGTNAASFTATTSIEISASPPANVTTGPITVTTSLGSYTTTSNFHGQPSITGFLPSSGRAGTNVVVTGRNFLDATAVRFNGQSCAFTVNSNSQLTATVPAGAHTGLITVEAPAGSPVTSSNFVVIPNLTSFAPANGPVNTSVTIYGANFDVGTPVVKFNNVASASVTVVNAGQLTATVPNGATTGPISVTTTDGTATSATLFYLPPRITGFTPTNSPPGTSVKITGTNFTDATSVQFNGTPASFTITNNNTIGATVPFGFTTGPITVSTPGGTTNTSSLATSNFYAAPIITGFSPGFGLPGTNVTINGSSFLSTSAVRFQAGGGGTTNAAIVSVANGQITVRVPTNAITGPITVVAPGGTDTSASSFQLQYAELLVSVTDGPDPVQVGSDLTYNILVKNFGPYASVVTMTNVLPPGVNFVSSTAGATTSNVTTVNFGTMAYLASTNVTIIARPNTAAITITNLTTAYSGPLPSYTPTATTTYVEPLRQLSIGFYSPGVVLLSWPTTLSNFTLQYKSSLATNVAWVDVLTTPATNGGSNLIAEPHTGAAKYYRLKR